MTNTLLITSAFLILGSGAAVSAQQPPAQPGQSQGARNTATPAVLKGCLTKGTQAKTYTLADEATGQTVTFAGSARLDDYVNQTVELTGDMVERDGEKSFQPRTVKTVTSSCKSRQD